MRVFIAVELPNEIREALSAVQRDLRHLTNTVRWVAADSIHITLKFIGEIPDKRIEDIDTALTGLTWKAFTVTVRSVGFFPGTRSPRVFWAGMEAPTMPGLAEQLDARLERSGFDKEKRAFRPHITLARAKNTRIDGALVSAAAQYEDHQFGSFVVDRVFVFKSTLKPSGAVYEKIREFLL
jgi:RNA 2',3'-cyclic 3'-phosphodiesterase